MKQAKFKEEKTYLLIKIKQRWKSRKMTFKIFAHFFIKVIVLINELSQGRRNSNGVLSMSQKE